MNEVVIRRLYRRIKDASGDSFKVLPISGIIRNEEVNPFESSIVLRLGYAMTSFSSLSHKSIEVENQSFGSEEESLPLDIEMNDGSAGSTRHLA